MEHDRFIEHPIIHTDGQGQSFTEIDVVDNKMVKMTQELVENRRTRQEAIKRVRRGR